LTKILNNQDAFKIAERVARSGQKFRSAEMFYDGSRTNKRYDLVYWIKNNDFKIELDQVPWGHIENVGMFAIWLVERKPKCLDKKLINLIKNRLSNPNIVVSSCGENGNDRAWLEHHYGHLWNNKKKLNLIEAKAILSKTIKPNSSHLFMKIGSGRGCYSNIKNWCSENNVTYEIYRKDYIYIPNEDERIVFNLMWH
tara:strand:- start:10308 stop:10898 length:591 start_codon:yes stop_codon:yes gene_type:complete